VLKGDRDTENPPAFICKHRSLRQSKEFITLEKKQKDAGDDADKLFEIYIELLVLGIFGWENMGRDFPADKTGLSEMLIDLLSVEETVELMEVIINDGVTSEDKKKSGSPSQLDTAADVKTAKESETAKPSPPD
jgi:hypothetical protein